MRKTKTTKMSNVEELIKKFEAPGARNPQPVKRVKRPGSLRNPLPVSDDVAESSNFRNPSYGNVSVFGPATTTINNDITQRHTDTGDTQITERKVDHSQEIKNSDHKTLHKADTVALRQTLKGASVSTRNDRKHATSKHTFLPYSVSMDRLEDLGYFSNQHSNLRGTCNTDDISRAGNKGHQSDREERESKPETEKRVSALKQESSVHRQDASVHVIKPDAAGRKAVLHPEINSDKEPMTKPRGQCSDQDHHKEPAVERGKKFKSFFKEFAHVFRPKKKYYIKKPFWASSAPSVQCISIKNTREETQSESEQNSVNTSTTNTVNAASASPGQGPDYSIPVLLPELKKLKEHCIQSFKKIYSYDRMMAESIRALDYHHQTDTEINELILHVMDEITSEMDTRFRGVSIGIGSFYDKTKVTHPDEFHFLYEMRNISFDWVPAEQDFCYKVVPDPKLSSDFSDVCEAFEGCTVLISYELHAAFAKAMTKAMDGVKLPDKLEHAGFRSPRFSGGRISGPAVTILLHYLNDGGKTFIKVDITPALPFAVEDIDGIEWPEVVTDYLGKSDAVENVHLIPGERRQTWKLSTANLELGFMKEELKDSGKVCRIIRIAKSLHQKYMVVRGTDEEEERRLIRINATAMTKKHIREGTLPKIVKMLDKERKTRDLLLLHQSCKDLVDSDKGEKAAEIKRVMEDIGDRLQGSMLYGWSEIDPITLSLTNEIEQPYIASKSCAVKYVVLDKLFKGSLQDADPSGPRPSEIREVMEGSTKEVVSHALLKIGITAKRISLFAKKSIPRVKGAHWVDLHSEVCSEFLAKLNDGTTPVTDYQRSPNIRQNPYKWDEDRYSTSSDRTSQDTYRYPVTEDSNSIQHTESGRLSEYLRQEALYVRNIQRQSSQQIRNIDTPAIQTVNVICGFCQHLNVLQFHCRPSTMHVEMGTTRAGRHEKRSVFAREILRDKNAPGRLVKKTELV